MCGIGLVVPHDYHEFWCSEVASFTGRFEILQLGPWVGKVYEKMTRHHFPRLDIELARIEMGM